MNSLDKLISYFNPKAGMKRAAYRTAMEHVRAYDAAARTRRTESWKATGADANREIGPQLATLRNRSREQVRNNVYARRAVQAIHNNVVGAGIRPTPEGVTRAAEKRIITAWKAWAEKTTCDHEGRKTFYAMQKLVMRTVAESGEALVVKKRVKPTDKNPLGMELHVIEPDYIDTSRYAWNVKDNNFIIHGVQVSPSGKIQGYWLYDRHPGGEQELNLVSKFYGAEDVAHIFYEERPGQVRGVPWLVASMTRMRDFDDYEDAELMRQKIAACFTAFIQDASPESIVGNAEAADLASRVEPGIIEVLPPGKTVTFGQPPTTQNYGDYSRKILQGIAAGAGITYEAMTGDLSNVNFSSGRMGWLEFHRNVGEWQRDMLIPMLCDKVWGWFMQSMAILGRGNVETIASWTPPRREMIDPKTEGEAMKLMVRNGFISFSEAVRQLGYDPDDTLEEIASDFGKMDALGIKLDIDPRIDAASAAPGGGEGGEGQSDADKVAAVRGLIDAYGIGVRAGVITPVLEDETMMRAMAGLPGVNTQITDAWTKDGGVRKPITLKGETEVQADLTGQAPTPPEE